MKNRIYIQKNTRNIYNEYEFEIDNVELGSTWEDYVAGKWVMLTDAQLSFREENPSASVQEVFNMELVVIPEPEPEPEPEPYIPTMEDQAFMFVPLLAMASFNTIEISDEKALELPDLHPEWSDQIGQNLKAGFRCKHKGRLYKTAQPVLVQAHQAPDGIGMEAIYTEVNEVNAGTLADPIPYNGNMLLEVGKYYIQDSIIYRCTREIQATHPLSALVGHYVEVV